MIKLWYGGSFNPIHHGHLICARAAAEAVGAETLVLVPSSTPPHKERDKSIALPQHRLAMVKVATAGVRGIEVDDREIRRGGPSYTIDTVRELKREGHAEVAWLIGADMLMSLPTWRQSLDLLAEARFVVMARPGWALDWNQLPAPYRVLEKSVVTAPLIDISATDIRHRVAGGRPVEYLTPQPVVDYIQKHTLYRDV